MNRPIESRDHSAERARPSTAELRVQASAVPAAIEPSPRTSVTFYVPEALRNRARTAYRSTSFAEKDASWSEMLNKALLAEVERREAEHNGGATFEGGTEPLTPGRPIGF